MSPVGHPEAPPVEERWQLDDLFEDLAAFERARQELRDEVLPTLDRHKGRLLGSAGELADALDGAYEARLKLTRLLCFASLKSDEDTRVGVDLARRQETQLLATETSRKLSFLRPEILDGDPKTIGRFLDSEPRLAVHRRFLTDLLRQRPYVLAPGEEQIMARTGLLRGQGGCLQSGLLDRGGSL